MFTHKPVEIAELSTKNVNRKRFYVTPEGKLYPSITTVLSRRKMEGLMEWRKRVGKLLQENEMMIGMSPTIFKHLHMQKCLKNELELKSIRLLF